MLFYWFNTILFNNPNGNKGNQGYAEPFIPIAVMQAYPKGKGVK